MSSSLEIARVASAALAYHVLAHLDLGRDAASLFDPQLPERPWRRRLLEAYRAAPGRLVVHALPLLYPEDLEDVLREGAPQRLRHADDQALAHVFAEAMDAERESFLSTFEATEADDRARAEAVQQRIGSELERLRTALWERRGEAPTLRVYDCRALGLAGRGASTTEGRAVAVSLAAPVEHIVCQVLHEEVHAITDPAVLGGAGAHARDTRAGSPGHAIHHALEEAAIEVGGALIDARAPAWSAAYDRWRARFSL
jgi:hypothetical protein